MDDNKKNVERLRGRCVFKIMLLVFLPSVAVFAQHIPVAHSHVTSICYGYAMGRAFEKSWNDPICPAQDLYTRQMDETYFTRYDSCALTDLVVGDIIEFGLTHVAYISNIANRDIDGIQVDQVDGEGASEQKNLKLRWVIEGHCDPWVRSQGWPIGYYRKRKE